MKEQQERKDNPGWFRPGPDPRRHQFTVDECVTGGVRGFKRCLEKFPDLYGYLMARALSAGRKRERQLRAGQRQQDAAR